MLAVRKPSTEKEKKFSRYYSWCHLGEGDKREMLRRIFGHAVRKGRREASSMILSSAP